jgi:hypothetical protein
MRPCGFRWSTRLRQTTPDWQVTVSPSASTETTRSSDVRSRTMRVGLAPGGHLQPLLVGVPEDRGHVGGVGRPDDGARATVNHATEIGGAGFEARVVGDQLAPDEALQFLEVQGGSLRGLGMCREGRGGPGSAKSGQ